MKAVVTHLSGDLFINIVSNDTTAEPGTTWDPTGTSYSISSLKETLEDEEFWIRDSETAELLSDVMEETETLTPTMISLLCYNDYEIVKVIHSTW